MAHRDAEPSAAQPQPTMLEECGETQKLMARDKELKSLIKLQEAKVASKEKQAESLKERFASQEEDFQRLK